MNEWNQRAARGGYFIVIIASAMAQKIHDHCFGEQFAAHYQEGRIQAEGSVEWGATFYFTLVVEDVGG